MKFEKILGIDIGGSGIKGAPINVKNGRILASRYRIETPETSSPKAVAKVHVKDPWRRSWNHY